MIIYLSLCQTFSVAVSYLSAILSHDWTVELEFWQWRIVEGPDSSLICAGKCTIIHVFEVKSYLIAPMTMWQQWHCTFVVTVPSGLVYQQDDCS